jgi:hypothetical protein
MEKTNEDLFPVIPPDDCGLAGCMGPIGFPRDGHIGSGDGVATSGKKKKKNTYTQMPSEKVLSFEEFMKIAKDVQ